MLFLISETPAALPPHLFLPLLLLLSVSLFTPMESLLLAQEQGPKKNRPSSSFSRGGKRESNSFARWALALAAATLVALAAVSSSTFFSSSSAAPFVVSTPVRRSSQVAPSSSRARLLAQQRRAAGSAVVATTSIKESGR